MMLKHTQNLNFIIISSVNAQAGIAFRQQLFTERCSTACPLSRVSWDVIKRSTCHTGSDREVSGQRWIHWETTLHVIASESQFPDETSKLQSEKAANVLALYHLPLF